MGLALGTVQFGLSYGAFNETGQVSAGEARSILGEAERAGIDVLDTAHAYGGAEEALGTLLSPGSRFRIVTKTAVGAPDPCKGFRESLDRLRRESVYGLLVHHAGELLGPGGETLWRALEKLRSDGLVSKIGVSVYTGAEIDEALARYPIELIQVPINVFDQRLLQGGQLKRLKARGVEIHSRSAFLQGLLISPIERLPKSLERARAPLEAYFRRLGPVSPVAAALKFLRQIPEIDEIVVGVLSAKQLIEIIRAYSEEVPQIDFSNFALSDEKILNPALWGKA